MRQKRVLTENKNWFDHFMHINDLMSYRGKTIWIIDCDGVMTDGKSYYTEDGKVMKAYGAYDKEALEFVCYRMQDVVYMCTEDNAGRNITLSRMRHLGNSLGKNFNYSGCESTTSYNRLELAKMFKEKFPDKNIVFVGDSLSDIPCMSVCDYAYCPANAPHHVWEYCNWVPDLYGGNGALSEIIFYHYKNVLKKKENE